MERWHGRTKDNANLCNPLLHFGGVDWGRFVQRRIVGGVESRYCSHNISECQGEKEQQRTVGKGRSASNGGRSGASGIGGVQSHGCLGRSVDSKRSEGEGGGVGRGDIDGEGGGHAESRVASNSLTGDGVHYRS